MKTLILYYTLGGASKAEAERLAAELGADVRRVRETRTRGLLGSFLPGVLQAMRRQRVAIQPLGVELGDYDRLILGCPVWAEFPAPAFNSMVALLPAGKEVELFLCSASSGTKKTEAETRALVEKRGCRVLSYRDVLTGAAPGKLRE